jgi:hypothetical protein
MAGYVRQSAGQIVNGQPVVAPPINNEFNQLQDAFDGTGGHAHDGTTGNGPKINLATSVAGYLPAANGGTGVRNNATAVTDPTNLMDTTLGYGPGSIWVNTSGSRIFICLSGAANAAVWVQVFYKSTTGHFLPQTTGLVDLGSDTQRFRDLYMSRDGRFGRDLYINGSATILGTLAVTGAVTLGAFSATNADINGGNIDATPIGVSVASTVRGTVITALNGFVGDLIGNVTGNLTGNVTGNVTGNLTGDINGNVTGDITSAGTSVFNNVTITGLLDMSAGTASGITGLPTPVNPTDAATKAYVDAGIAAVLDAAPAALDTLNELAAALGDDPNFATTITNMIGTKLSLSGGTMAGNISMDGLYRVINLPVPVNPADAATKAYVDAGDALKVNKAGDTMTGNLSMGGNKVTTTADPTAPEDLARKAYVDSILGSATSAATSASEAQTFRNQAEGFKDDAAASATAADNTRAAIDAVYLGVKAADPVTDNEGGPLQIGAWYLNTSDGRPRIYTASGWSGAVFDTNGALVAANNLSDLADPAVARTNLGLGTAALQPSTAFATAEQGTKADTAHGWGDHALAGYLTSVAAMGGYDEAAAAQVLEWTASALGLTTRRIREALAPVTIPGTSNWTPDWGAFHTANWVITDNRTINNPTNVLVGETKHVYIKSSSTIARTIFWGSYYEGNLPDIAVTNSNYILVSMKAETTTKITVSFVEIGGA